ncbi:hypothetical protein BJ085DRAFT_32063 [Dimargaris cristalligena]|uniref:Uncharacterized protein n=1 Tax=Dimargaris cristalligena TaxID=215637 RepID=A0A4P9ZLX3_9FUNG|nr:hypothetical protein BJ085DRAFT_32063 [Dimargaris cristalligena]|eukprot:RKP34108.1 hypothetical protein BJ085DRAFT_32063 [Dimargaris cristalligena]
MATPNPLERGGDRPRSLFNFSSLAPSLPTPSPTASVALYKPTPVGPTDKMAAPHTPAPTPPHCRSPSVRSTAPRKSPALGPRECQPPIFVYLPVSLTDRADLVDEHVRVALDLTLAEAVPSEAVAQYHWKKDRLGISLYSPEMVFNVVTCPFLVGGKRYSWFSSGVEIRPIAICDVPSSFPLTQLQEALRRWGHFNDAHRQLDYKGRWWGKWVGLLYLKEGKVLPNSIYVFGFAAMPVQPLDEAVSCTQCHVIGKHSCVCPPPAAPVPAIVFKNEKITAAPSPAGPSASSRPHPS